ncbi:MAG: hypothetical protein EOR84_18060 [Mesorhizobium sp.]|uniref:hypothetical protein n=1 Tax=Mesorhizobium sp. TaxID=1871066 RepID=UPI000FE83EF5|nr:hypothetical protein [Mesorhizobium sp.]RWM93419.1 MAG: hypothetical protein EOR84_18060 [Mesorhizobium sp.]
MAKRDAAGHKTLAEAFREMVSTEDYRRHANKLFGLKVEPELTPTLASLLEAIGKAGRDETP